jgi:flavin-dependent dehydrogenase
LLAIGDSAAFIDPFTGSGMLMAFESGELAAEVIVRHRDKLTTNALGAEYAAGYIQKFDSRLRISGWLRRAGFQATSRRTWHRHLRRQQPLSKSNRTSDALTQSRQSAVPCAQVKLLATLTLLE